MNFPNLVPIGITAGPDGALWFAGSGDFSVWRITTPGVATAYPTPTYGSEVQDVAKVPDGDLWFTEFGGNKIGRAPACGLGLSASYADSTLTMKFDLGIDTPGNWSLSAGGDIGQIAAIPATVPPQAFRIDWSPFPGSGDVVVTSALSDHSGHTICSEWVTVNTGE